MESTTQTVRVNPNSSEEYDYSGEDGGAGIDMESIESGPEGVDDDGGVPREEMATPLVTGIISQTIRTSPGGNQVVDIVIEVEDIPGAINYDYRIAKVG